MDFEEAMSRLKRNSTKELKVMFVALDKQDTWSELQEVRMRAVYQLLKGRGKSVPEDRFFTLRERLQKFSDSKLKDIYQKNDRLKHTVETIEVAKDILKKRGREIPEQGETNYWRNKLDQMSGYEFEELVANLFANMEYETRVTRKAGDQGVDVIAKRPNETLAIQTKCYNNKKVSNSAVQEVVAGKNMIEADKAIVVANSNFTSAARELAQANQVKLINKAQLLAKINKHSLMS